MEIVKIKLNEKVVSIPKLDLEYFLSVGWELVKEEKVKSK